MDSKSAARCTVTAHDVQAALQMTCPHLVMVVEDENETLLGMMNEDPDVAATVISSASASESEGSTEEQ